MREPGLSEVTGPTRVSGGAGSGKTYLLARLAADWLRQGLAPRRLVVVTRSHSSVRHFAQRVEALLPDSHPRPRVLTQEGLARAALLEAGLPDHRTVALNRIGEWLAMRGALRQALPLLDRLRPLADDPACVEDALEFSSLVKQALVGPGLLAERLRSEGGLLAELAVVAAGYQRVLGTMDARDTRDLTADAVELLQRDQSALQGWADVLLVDEAEDLNPAQWHLIRELTMRLPAPHRAVLAGDRRVAVPSFRGPTARFFDDVFPRTMAPVEWALGDVTAAWVERAARALGQAVPAAPAAPEGVGASLRVHPRRPRCRIWKAADEMEEALAIAREIKRARLAGEFSYGEAAILLWNQPSQIGPILEALGAVGVPVAVEQQRWGASLAVRLVVLWLRALLDPGNDEKVLPILSEGPGSLSPEEVLELRQDAASHQDSLSAALRRLAGAPAAAIAGSEAVPPPAQLWRRLGGGMPGFAQQQLSASEFSRLLGDVQLGSGLAELALSDRETAVALAQLNLAVAEATEASERLGAGSAGLAHWLELLQTGVRRSGSATEMGGQPDCWEVSVLTVAHAKGRSWRQVFLPGLVEGLVPGNVRDFGVLTPAETQRLLELLPELDEVMGAPGHAAELARRLMVVGLTRATEQVTLSWAARRDGVDQQPSPFLDLIRPDGVDYLPAPSAAPVTSIDCLTQLAVEIASGRHAGAGAGGGDLEALATDLAECLGPWDPVLVARCVPEAELSATSVRAWLACPRLHYYGLLRPRQQASVPLVLGVAAHRLLESAHQRRPPAGYDQDGFIATARVVAEELMPDVRRRLVDPLASLFVELWLDQLIQRWAGRVVARDQAGTQLASELPFHLKMDGFHLAGKVDALWRHADGRLEVVDFKTTASAPPSVPGLSREVFGSEDEGPSDWQLPIYALAVRRGAFSQMTGSELPMLARNWYLGEDPGRNPELVARGFRLGNQGGPMPRGQAELTWEQLDRVELELQRQAEIVRHGEFPAAPRHDNYTCRGHLGCPLDVCCDGEGSVGKGVAVPRPRP